MRRKKIGTMDFHGSVDITDPCYNKGVWCRMNDIKIKEGIYTCMVWYQKDKGECSFMISAIRTLCASISFS